MTDKMTSEMTGEMTESINPGWISRSPGQQAEFVVHYPHALQSGWLPKLRESLQAFHRMILDAERTEYAQSIKELDQLIEGQDVIEHLIKNACRENLNLYEKYQREHEKYPERYPMPIPRIKDKETFLHGLNVLLKKPPSFVNNELVGLPFSAWVLGIDPTLSGVALFGLPMFNRVMSAVLQQWFKFLGTIDSAAGFTKEGEQWLSLEAKKKYRFEDWKKDQAKLPYWTSWNSFFTRLFKDPKNQRPIADPDSNRTAIAANDGSLYRWASNMAKRDVFWFKDMAYSLADILSSPLKEQQDLIDKHGLVEMFTNGYIFQTYLNPYNFHRWWVPVNGEVLFDPFTIPGDFFNKLVIPDYGGATTESLPYLAQVNARGVIVFKTLDYGHVCCIPLGMSEVSTITFDKQMYAGAKVTKGKEMGTFNYGGSSFVIIYEHRPHKKLIFMDAEGKLLPENPVTAPSSSGTGGVVTNIGSKIGQWVDI